MKTPTLASILAVLGSMPLFALGLSMDDRGVVEVSQQGDTIVRATVNMHSPGWRNAANAAGATASRDNDRVEGSIALPDNCQGQLSFSVSARKEGDAANLSYELSFTEPNEILGAYVSFMLPASRFGGRQAMLLPGGQSATLPVDAGDVGLDGAASAAALQLTDGNWLVIAGDAVGRALIQDNRQFGSNQFELRFHLFGQGRVHPAMRAARTVRIATAARDDVSTLVNDMAPQTSLDPEQPFALVEDRGTVRVGTRNNVFLNIFLAIHGLDWAYTSQGEANVEASGGGRQRFFTGVMQVPASDDRTMEFVETARKAEDEALQLEYELSFPQAVELNGYQVSFQAQLDEYAGTELTLRTPDGPESVVIPQQLDERFLHSGPVQTIAVAPDDPHGFSIKADEPTNLLIQDNRGWGGDTIEFRFNFMRDEQGARVPAGENVRRAFTFRLNSPLQIALSEAGATSRTDTADWVPFTLPWDAAPVDLSFLNHRPAGKYGFVQAKDGRFVLSQTGQEIRFWGTCFSAGANFPSHEQAEKTAHRLARFGVNMVRTHHADAPWAERHFFDKTKDDTRHFDPENLDRFDYLVHCLKQQGIYVYLDQLVNRYFKTGDDVDAVGELGACAKPYSNFDPRLIELQKEFSRKLWSHVNPYTGLAYKDDPAIALMEFANENDLFTQEVTLEPYRTRLERRYRQWAQANDVVLPDGQIDFRRVTTDAMMRFLVHIQRGFYDEMESFLRERVGVSVPMTGSNWSRNAALLAALRDMQYTDSHAYWNHPASDGRFGNTPMVGAERTIFSSLAFQRLVGKPFFVSEWGEPWPNEWRAELTCWLAAIAAFQEWNGTTVYTYRHSSQVPVRHLSGAFETFNDPAVFGLFPHAALIFRRPDVAPANQKMAVHISRESAESADTPNPWGSAAYRGIPELHRIDTALFRKPEGYDTIVTPDQSAGDLGPTRTADTGEIWRDVESRVARIDTPRTQVVFGFLGAKEDSSTTDMTVNCDSPFATIALSSLSSDPIATSDHLLLTAVGRAENTGFTYNLLRNRRLDAGEAPILIDPIRAQISIRNSAQAPTITAIGPRGEKLSTVESTSDGERLNFTIGPASKTIYYEIAR